MLLQLSEFCGFMIRNKPKTLNFFHASLRMLNRE